MHVISAMLLLKICLRTNWRIKGGELSNKPLPLPVRDTSKPEIAKLR